ncbi:MAG: glycosyltransferase 87 family protein [Candidatus Bathyarchaeia archaeon]
MKASNLHLHFKRRAYALILGYSMVIAVIYALPVGLGYSEWLSFYSYLDLHKAQPYIDVREGYPPLGFLIYQPLYQFFGQNVEVFNYGFRALNGILLACTLAVLYLILRSMFEEGRASKLALYYALLPSVIIANAYSNDVVALFPAALAILMMKWNKPLLCGLLIGIATLGKGFPFLLLLPGLIAFTRKEEKVIVVGSALALIAFASLPFMILNPLTYLSTFTHVGSRGPWETIWAFLDGYFSHGGLLHPYFDKFFYHFNLLRIYSANSYDHAIYKWNFGILPYVLTALQVIFIVVIFLFFIKRRGDIVKLCGLLYVTYMLFFKGYSTQFAVSTPFYVLLAVEEDGLLFLLPLEASHIMQMLSWGSEVLVPEVLRNWHLPLLISAVVLRTGVCLWLVIDNLMHAHGNLRQSIIRFASVLYGYIKFFMDKRVFGCWMAALLAFSFSLSSLYSQINDESTLTFHKDVAVLSAFDWENVAIGRLKRGDQVFIKLATNTWVYAEILPDDLANPIEKGVRNPYNLKGSFNETLLFFKAAESDSYSLMLKMAHPFIPFRVTDGLDRDLEVNITTNGSSLVLRLRDKGEDGKESTFRMVYPFSAYVDDDFSLIFKYKILEGAVSNVFVDVFDDTDDWIYAFNAAENFVLNAESESLLGCSNLYGDEISLIGVTLNAKDCSSATVELRELNISCNGETHSVKFYSKNTEKVGYEVFIERDWQPPIYYTASLVLAFGFGLAAIYFMHKKLKVLGK